MKNRVPLIIKSNIDAPAWARVPGVEWINSFLPERDYEKLWERCMIYVSPHRSEGIGMSIVEAMGRGKPVVATGYGGNTEFMRSSFSEMIPYSWVPVPSDVRETYRPIAGFPVPDPCSDSLAVILDRLVEDRRRLERMADAASQRHSAMVEEWNVNMPIIIGKII